MNSSVLWGITPSSPLKVNRRFKGTCCLPPASCRCLAWLILRPLSSMFHVAPKRRLTYIPEDKTPHNHCSENLKCFIMNMYFRCVILYYLPPSRRVVT
jgi:hypothetical protein